MKETLKSIGIIEFNERLKQGGPVEVIDVRTPAEFGEVHMERARNVPLDQLKPDQFMEDRIGAPDEPLYVFCKTGARANMACRKFAEAGYAEVYCVDGGINGWIAQGLSVIQGRKTMSLERQVRIVAGFLVLLGALLGYFVHLNWLGISAFVGAGLMFAGITDTCGMGMMLARMPWNRRGGNAE